MQVFLLTHIASGRGFVGWTSLPLGTRWLIDQLSAARGYSDKPYYALIRDEGAEAFSVRVLAEYSDPGDARRRGFDEIAKRKTYAPHGFNGVSSPVLRRINQKDHTDGSQSRQQDASRVAPE